MELDVADTSRADMWLDITQEFHSHTCIASSWSEFSYEYTELKKGDNKFILRIKKDGKFIGEQQKPLS